MMGSITGGARLVGTARRGRLRSARRMAVAAVHLLAVLGVVMGTSEAPAAAAVPVPPFVQVDNGSGTSCGLTADGQAYCWGRDSFGQVGNGPGTGDQYEPVPVDAPAGVVWSSISVGALHTCALTTTGAAYCWGGDFSRQLGNGPGITADQQSPGPVVTPSGVTWAAISAGLSSTCAMTTGGQLYCWGGMGDDYEGPSPNLVPGGPWANVVVGSGVTCGVTTSGAGFCWGPDFNGRLGNGPAITAFQRSPSPVATPQGVHWARITPGEATCGLTTSGAAYCWGPDTRGALGNGPAIVGDQPSPSPVDAPAGVLWSDLAVLNEGASAACALSDAGAIYCWGSDSVGQQANGPGVTDQASPGPIVAPPGVVWASLSGGGANACAAAVGDPTTYCWGTDFFGSLGDGLPAAPADAPTPVGAGQTIDFAPIADVVVGAPPFTVAATASSGQPVTYQAEGPCSVDGSTVTPTAVGTCTVTAAQAGGNGWGAASAERSFTIRADQEPQTISFPQPADRTFGDPPFTVAATASSGLPVSFTVPSGAPCTVAGSTVTITGAGDCAITASQAGDDDHLPADPQTRTVVIGKAFQSIITYSPGVHRFGDDPFLVRADTTSGLPVTFTVRSGGPCTIAGDLVTITGVGDCEITASQPGNGNYLPADPQTVTAEIGRTGQTIAFEPLPSVVYGTSPFELTATASSALAVVYDATGTCAVAGSTLTITGAGTCAVTASQPGNDTVDPATPVTRSFGIAKASQEITFDHPGSKTFGDAPFALSASTSSGLPVTFSVVSGPCTVAGSTVTITGAGLCEIEASQAGNGDYEAAASVTRTVTVQPAPLTITASDGTMTYGGTSPTVTPSYSGFVGSDGPSVLTTAAVCGGGTPTTTAGVHPLGTSCSGATAASYAITYVHGSLTVAKAVLTVTADPKSMVHRQPVPALTATITGFRNGETAAVLSGSPALSTTATSTSSVGTYPITVTEGGLAAQNYTFAFVPGALTVTPAATVLAVDPVILRISPLGVPLGKVTARLSLADPALPLAGHTITFTTGSTSLCTATTAADGTATCRLSLAALLTTIFGGGYQAAFAGTPDLLATTGAGALVS